MCFKTDLLFFLFFLNIFLSSIFYLWQQYYIFFYFLKLQNFFNSKLSKKKCQSYLTFWTFKDWNYMNKTWIKKLFTVKWNETEVRWQSRLEWPYSFGIGLFFFKGLERASWEAGESNLKINTVDHLTEERRLHVPEGIFARKTSK